MSSLFTSKNKTSSTISPAQESSIKQRTGVESALTNQIFDLLGFSPQVGNNREPGVDDAGSFTKTGRGVGEQLANTFQLGQGEKALAGVIGESGGSLAQILRQALPGLTGELNTDAFVNPLFERFQEETLPGIRSRALQLGVPSGSREGDVTNQAVGRFGSAVGDTLSRAELQRRSGESNILAQLLPQIFGFETGGAQAQAQTDALGRQLEGQRITAPLDILTAILQGTPRPQFKPADVTNRNRASPISTILDIASAAAEFK